MEQQLTSANKMIEQLKEDLDVAEKGWECEHASNQEKEGNIFALEHEYTEYQDRTAQTINALQLEIEAHKKQNRDLVEAANKRIQEYQDENARVQLDLSRSNEIIEQARSQEIRLRDANDNAQGLYQSACTSAINGEQQLRAAQDYANHLQTSYTELLNEYRKVADTNVALQSQYADSCSKLATLTSECGVLQSKLVVATEQYEKHDEVAQKTIEDLKQEHAYKVQTLGEESTALAQENFGLTKMLQDKTLAMADLIAMHEKQLQEVLDENLAMCIKGPGEGGVKMFTCMRRPEMDNILEEEVRKRKLADEKVKKLVAKCQEMSHAVAQGYAEKYGTGASTGTTEGTVSQSEHDNVKKKLVGKITEMTQIIKDKGVECSQAKQRADTLEEADKAAQARIVELEALIAEYEADYEAWYDQMNENEGEESAEEIEAPPMPTHTRQGISWEMSIEQLLNGIDEEINLAKAYNSCECNNPQHQHNASNLRSNEVINTQPLRKGKKSLGVVAEFNPQEAQTGASSGAEGDDEAKPKKKKKNKDDEEEEEDDGSDVARKLLIPTWPSHLTLSQFDAHMTKNLIVAGRKTDNLEIEFYKKCREAKTYEELEPGSVTNKRLIKLDALLSVGMYNIMPEKLKRKMDTLAIDALKEGKVPTGRQHVWMMYDYFKTEPHMQEFYNHFTITTLKWFGDKPHRMQQFLDIWDKVWNNCVDPPGSDVKRDMFYEQMKQSTALKTDVDHFAREKAKGIHSKCPEDVSYKYLRMCCDAHLARVAFDKNIADQQAEFKKLQEGGGKDKNPALAAEKGKGKGKGKKNKKGKGKGQKGGGGASSGTDPHKNGSFDPRDDPQKRCFFFNLGTCKKGSACDFEHSKVPPNEFKKWKYPNAQSRQSSAAPSGDTTPNGSKKGKSKGKGKTWVNYCPQYLKEGKCDYKTKTGKDCKREHLDQAALDKKKADLNVFPHPSVGVVRFFSEHVLLLLLLLLLLLHHLTFISNIYI